MLVPISYSTILRIDIAVSGPTSFIHYNGKDYTPLEFQEFIATNIPGRMTKAVQDSLRSLKGIEDNIAGYDKLIELTNHPTEKKTYEGYRQKRIQDRTRELAFLHMLLATEPYVNATAAELGRQVEAMK